MFLYKDGPKYGPSNLAVNFGIFLFVYISYVFKFKYLYSCGISFLKKPKQINHIKDIIIIIHVQSLLNFELCPTFKAIKAHKRNLKYFPPSAGQCFLSKFICKIIYLYALKCNF